MYSESWELNHRFYLSSREEYPELDVPLTHILYFGQNDFYSEAETLRIHWDVLGWQDIQDIIDFAGEAFVEDYRFRFLICHEEYNIDRAISAFLIAKHCTVGENGKDIETYLELINPKIHKYEKKLIDIYEKVTEGDDSLRHLCEKIWR